MKYAAAGGVVALAILFGAIMAIRGGDSNQTATGTPGGETSETTDSPAQSGGGETGSPTTEPQPTDTVSDTTAPEQGTSTETSTTAAIIDVITAVSFNSGETSTALNGTVGPNERAIFTIAAGAGQTLNLELTFDSGSPSYEVLAPSGQKLVLASVSSSTALDVDGVYEVIVTDGVATTDFVLSIEVPAPELRIADFVDPTGIEEIKFPRGAFSTTVSSAVVRAEAEIYTFDTNDDVTAYVSITSLEDNAVFQIYDPDGSQLAFESINSTWPIEQAGLYTIIVTGTRGNASFDLTLELS